MCNVYVCLSALFMCCLFVWVCSGRREIILDSAKMKGKKRQRKLKKCIHNKSINSIRRRNTHAHTHTAVNVAKTPTEGTKGE